jgi:hypothetical protein
MSDVKKLQYGFLIAGLAVMVIELCSTSCGTPVLYVSNSVQMPLLKEKGEVKASAALEESNGLTYSFQGAYALTNDLGFIGSYLFSLQGTDSMYSATSFGEIGLGYHHAFDQVGVFEVYGGLGFGKVRNGWSHHSFSGFGSDDSDIRADTTETASYFRPFIQADFGGEGKVGAIAVGCRLSHVNVPIHKTGVQTFIGTSFDPNSNSFFYSNGPSYTTTGTASGLFIEPTVMFRLGYDPLKWVMQWTMPHFIGSGAPISYNSLISSLGIVFTFDTYPQKSSDSN